MNDKRDVAATEDPLESERLHYGQLFELFGPAIGPLAEELQARDDRRSTLLFDSVMRLGPVLIALGQVRQALLWMSRFPTLNPEVISLLHQSSERILVGAEAVFSNAGPRILDESRFLMEVQFLFHNFAEDRAEIDRWSSAELYRRNQNHGFSELRRKRERRLGVPHGEVLPDRNEYRVHSAAVHPRPSREVLTESNESAMRVTSLLSDLGDLLQHSFRLWEAAGELVPLAMSDPGAEVSEDVPSLDMLDDAIKLINELTRRSGVPEQAPRSLRVDDDGSDPSTWSGS